MRDTKVKITRRQLRRIIRESIDLLNTETGEVLVFADDDEYGTPDAPEAAAGNVLKRLGITQAPSSPGYQADRNQQTIDLSAEDWEDVHAEILGKRHTRKNKKERARMDINNLLAKVDQWADTAGGDYGADNPDVDMQDVAWDLASGAKYQFAKDEWDELIWHFDNSEDELITYIADIIA